MALNGPDSCGRGLFYIYATFFAHVISPAIVYVADPHTHLRLPDGRIGDIEEIFDWDGLLHVVAFSILMFVSGWCIMSLAAVRPLAHRRRFTTALIRRIISNLSLGHTSETRPRGSGMA